MKATLPPAICVVVILYSSWLLHLDRVPKLPLNTTDTVEITVRGPDGKIIKPMRPAP